MSKLNKQLSSLGYTKYQNEILNVDYWINILGPTQTAVDKVKYLRKFLSVLEKSKISNNAINWDPNNIDFRISQIQNEILLNNPKNITELSNFSDKHCQLNFWTFRGWNIENSINLQKQHQGKASHASKKAYDSNDEYFRNTDINFYLKKGLAADQAKQALANRQSTFSLFKCVEKYGLEHGKELWESRQNKWQATLNNKPEELKIEINKSKGKSFEKLVEKFGIDKAKQIIEQRTTTNSKFYSKESNIFFSNIIKHYSNYDYLYCSCLDKKEKFLWDENKIYFYDFCDLKNKIIIEYHGIKYHPKPEQYDFKQLKTNDDYYTCYNKDQLKKQIAIKNGFSFLEIYSDDKYKIEKTLTFLKDNNAIS